MIPEVRKIPAAPRRVRGGPILAHRWPMAALGLFLTGFGGLVSWMLFLAAGAKPSDQARLNDGPTVQATATVNMIKPAVIRGPDGRRWQNTWYEFRFEGKEFSGWSMTPEGICEFEQPITIELLPDTPRINRAVGGTLHFDRVMLRPETWLGLMVGPGIFLLFGWITGVFRLRHVLVHGDVSTGKLVAARPLRGVVPDSLVITFEFRDHRAVLRRGRHWVRARSNLGQLARRQVETGWFEPLPVLHDRKMSQWNRMVLAEDFLPTPVTETELEGIG